MTNTPTQAEKSTNTQEVCSLSTGVYFRQVVYGELGLSDADITVPVYTPELDIAGAVDMPLISEDKHGNLIFTPCFLNRQLWQVQDESVKMKRTKTYEITRWANPDEHDGNRYSYPQKKFFPSQMCFIPPTVIAKHEQGIDIVTLSITEGYKKAWAASKVGIDMIGLGSITHIIDTDTKRGGLFPDIVTIIRNCNVRNVIILWDGDCRNVRAKDIESGNELTTRPNGFVRQVVKLAGMLKSYDVDVFFSFVQSDAFPTHPKGLDDIIHQARNEQQLSQLVADYYNFDGDNGTFFYKTNITAGKNKLYDLFGLNNVNILYNLNKDTIGTHAFTYKGEIWEFDPDRGECRKNSQEAIRAARHEYDLPDDLPDEQVQCYLNYDIFAYQNCFFAKRTQATRDAVKIWNAKISDFSLESMYFIRGVKRIYKIRTQKNNHAETIELVVDDFQSKSNLSKKASNTESVVFWGNAMDLVNLQRYLFSTEILSLEIARIGQHKAGFYAWANGLFDCDNNRFIEVDAHGMVSYEAEPNVKSWYYIPASTTDPAAMEDYGGLIKMKHMPSDANFTSWSTLYMKTYGDNGMMGIAFACMSLFRDIIFKYLACSPMLFLFGQRGSGKSKLGQSLLPLWGQPQDVISLEGGTTPKAFIRMLRQRINSLILIDEWKNHLDKMVGPIKGIWDGYASGRAVFSNDDRTKDATLYSTAIVAGQELPTVEPALYSRFVLLIFEKTKHNDTKDFFQQLQKMEMAGLTSVTLEILKHRKSISEKFIDKFIDLNNTYQETYKDTATIDRQIDNYAIIHTIVEILMDCGVKFPFTIEQFITYIDVCITRQTQLMGTSDEVRTFFIMLPTLIKNKRIADGINYKLKDNELRLRLSTIIPEYRKECAQQRIKDLDEGTLESYLKTHAAFRGHKTCKFPFGSTTAYIFDYEKLNNMYELNLTWLDINIDEKTTEIGQPKTTVNNF